MLYYAAWWSAYIVTSVGIESFIYHAKKRAGKPWNEDEHETMRSFLLGVRICDRATTSNKRENASNDFTR